MIHTQRARIALGFAIAILLAIVAYWPSLQGGYAFDDYNNIVFNTAVHPQALDWASLQHAIESGPPSGARRPLAMLSFAVDWYLGGGDPLRMKVVNLIIHLINGLLLFGLLRRLCACLPSRPQYAHLRHGWLPLAVSAAWLLAPINFTAVAYIVQRMESLCQMFVLAGLWGYIAARARMRDGKPGLLVAVASIVLGTVLGGLSKESAVLLPVYALIAEWMLFAFARQDGKTDSRIVALFVVLLALPACIAMSWIALHALPAAAWVERPFTLGERLLTEPRVLWDYVRWTLLPLPNQMALYHDGIEISRGLFTPFTTAPAIVALAAAFIVAIALRKARPLVAIGILWFFAAHLLTGTVIPLELVFEHRNYFASVGLLLVFFAFVLPHEGARLPVLRSGLCFAIILFFAATTWIRALNWSNPLLQALNETKVNPHSPRAAYDLANIYMVLCQQPGNSQLVPTAFDALQHAADMPGASMLPEQAILLLSSYLHRDPPAGTWQRMQDKLAAQPLSAAVIDALAKLSTCTMEGRCAFAPQDMRGTFQAALTHQPPNTRVLSIYAGYANNTLHDPALAVDLARHAVAASPQDLQMRANLIALLSASGQQDQARTEYEKAMKELPEARQNGKFRALLDNPPIAPETSNRPAQR